MNCENCGAPVVGFACEYCGTQYNLDSLEFLPELRLAIQKTAGQLRELKVSSDGKSWLCLMAGLVWFTAAATHQNIISSLAGLLIIGLSIRSIRAIGQHNNAIRKRRAALNETLSLYISRYNDIARRNGLPDW